MRRFVLSIGLVVAATACRSRDRVRPDPASAASSGAVALPSSHFDSTMPSDETMVQIVIAKSVLLVDGKQIASIPSAEDAARDGFGAKYKPSAASLGPVAPLAAAMEKHRAAQGDDAPSHDEALVLATRDTPYRLLVEVLFTLGAERITKFHLLVMTDGKGPPLPVAAKLPPVKMDGVKPLSLTVHVGPDGVAFGTVDGAVGTGCKVGAPGVTVPRVAGALDLDAVRRCAQQLKSTAADEAFVLVSGTGATPYGEIIGVKDAVRSDGNVDLFPDSAFGPPR